MLDTYRLIITAAPESLAAALAELRFGQHRVLSTELEPGAALIELEQPLDELLAELERRPSIFIRHWAPVHRELLLDGTPGDLDRLAKIAVGLAEHLTAGKPFSVQTRLLGEQEGQLTRFDVNDRLAADIQDATGAALDVRQPHDILSVALAGERAYLGLSTAAFNRSSWAGGVHRFAREQGQLSRAEFKLLEAQAVFGFAWPDWGQALDLGAAPGGWTRVLRRAGLPVVAVDPAEMDRRIADDRDVRHLQIVAQQYLPTRESFSVIVNDIRMDARDSARLMWDAAASLEPGGIAVVTLKLPHEHSAKIAHHALAILASAYQVTGARQLFHNRSEVTAVLRPR